MTITPNRQDFLVTFFACGICCEKQKGKLEKASRIERKQAMDFTDVPTYVGRHTCFQTFHLSDD
jgi:hypothetical protein